jgi:hypothetical protein
VLGDFGDADTGATAHVVDLARGAVLDEEAIGAHDVADVGDVADRIERTDGDLADRFGVIGLARFGDRDAACERGHEEAIGLARTGVRERADPHSVQARAEVGLQREVRRGELARAVRRCRPQLGGLVDREVGGCHPSVLLGAADDEHARGTVSARGGQHVRGALDVDADDAGGIGPRLTDV